jgi:hypothetical protein
MISCLSATEEAVRLKEKKVATEIIAVSIGPKANEDVIRTAMAMGADKGIRIDTTLRTDQDLQPLTVAKALKAIIEVGLLVAHWCLSFSLLSFSSLLLICSLLISLLSPLRKKKWIW